MILLLAAISVLASLATQLLVPALPQLANDLRSSTGDAQLVIGLFLFGLGVGQLFAGPLSDRAGRKPVLLAGMALYCFASAAAAFAAAMPWLLAARFLQALGGSAGVVSARVLVADLFPPEEATARQATLMAVVLVSPMLAPVIGGFLVELAGWRMVFASLACAGVLVGLLALRNLPSRPSAVGGERRSIAAAWRALATNRRFLGPSVAMAGGSAAIYMFLGMAPFLLSHDHGLRPRAVGLCLMLVAATSIAGTFLVARVERRADALLTGSSIVAGSSLLAFVFALAGLDGIVFFIGPMALLGIGAGMAGPAAITRVIASDRTLAGTATSLAGALQMLVAALAGALLGRVSPASVESLALAMLVVSGAGLLATIWRRFGD